VVQARFLVDWDFDGTYTDESAHLISASGDMRLTPVGAGLATAQGIIAQAVITLRNASGRFSPLRTDGALYAVIGNGKAYHAPCRLEVSVNGGTNFYRVFTGVLKYPEERTASPIEGPTVRFEARGIEEKYLQRRVSTGQAALAANYEAGATEADVLASFLSAAGVPGVLSGQLVLDSGMFSIPWAWLDDESVIEECWQLAAACGGRFYADNDGILRYENMQRWQTATRSTTAQLALTRDNMENFVLRVEDSDLYNVVTVEASPRAVSGLEVIWEPDALPVLQPGETQTLSARFDAPAQRIVGLTYEAIDDGGNARTSDVSVAATYYAQRADLVFVNAGALRVRLYPLRIVGVPVVGGPEIEERVNSTSNGSNAAFFVNRGDRTLSIRSNLYLQTRTHARSLAQFLLDRCEMPRLTAHAYGVIGQPQLQLGDRVTVADAPTVTGAFAGYTTAIDWSFGARGFDQELTLVETSQMFAHDNNYFRVGVDAMGSTRKVFY
jgi:hypothetical protein